MFSLLDRILTKIQKRVAWRRPAEKVFLEILQNLQENTCARDSFLTKL